MFYLFYLNAYFVLFYIISHLEAPPVGPAPLVEIHCAIDLIQSITLRDACLSLTASLSF